MSRVKINDTKFNLAYFLELRSDDDIGMSFIGPLVHGVALATSLDWAPIIALVIAIGAAGLAIIIINSRRSTAQ